MAHPIRARVDAIRTIRVESTNGGSRRRGLSLLFANTALCAASAAGAQTTPPPVLPQGGEITAGQASIVTNGQTTSITQTSQRAIINWESFSIGQGGQVNIAQPGADAAILNRVTGNSATALAGALTANGQVYLVNPNGIVITPTGTVVAGGGFVGSTLGLGDDDFLAERLNFRGSGASTAIVNDGVISVGNGGFAALLGGRVTNRGTIAVALGKIGMGAGESATLDLSGDGFLQVAVPGVTDGDAPLIDAGGIIAGARVELRAASVVGAIRQAVNVPGELVVRGARQEGGAVILDGGKGAVDITGTIDASSQVGTGGRITVEGEAITLRAQSRLLASGATGGGTVLVGGAVQGGAGLAQATSVQMAAGSLIDASATQDGEGGSVVLWSDIANTTTRTDFAGTIRARGAGSGNGGFVETSGHAVDSSGGVVDAGADLGTGGLWLIDPADSVITQSIADSYAATLNTGTSVLNDVIGGITWGSGVTLSKTAGGNATLTLRTAGAGGTGASPIVLNNATIDSTMGALNLILWTRYNGMASQGTISITGSTINTNGGQLWLGGGGSGAGSLWNGVYVGGSSAATWSGGQQGVLINTSSIATGAGNLSIEGYSSSSVTTNGINQFGVMIDGGTTLSTTSGAISIIGGVDGRFQTGAGVWIGDANHAGSVAISTGSGAITIAGTGVDQAGSASGWRHGLMLYREAASGSTTIKTITGAINLTGTAAFSANDYTTGDSSGLQLQVVNTGGRIGITSASGAINLRGTNTLEANTTTINGLRLSAPDTANSIRIGFDGVAAYSGPITIEANSIQQRNVNAGAGSISVQTTGQINVQPVAASFSYLRANASSMTFDNDWNFGSSASGLTIGKSGNSYDLTLSSALTTAGAINVFAGNLVLNAGLSASGAIALNASGAGGLSGSAAGTIGNFNTLTLNVANASASGTLAGIISGSGSVIKSGAGRLALSGVNSYTGVNTLAGGTLSIAEDRNLGAVPGVFTAGSIVFNGGNLAFTNIVPTTLQANRGITMSANGTVTMGASLFYDGRITGAGRTLTTLAGDLILGNVTGTASSANYNVGGRLFYTSANALGSGTAYVNSGASLGYSGSSALTVANAVTLASGGILLTRNASLTYTNASLPTAGTIIFNRDDTPTAAITVTNNIVLTGPLTVQVGGNNASVGAATLSGMISGTYGLTKTASGTLSLGGMNSFSGPLTVSAGAVSIVDVDGLGASGNTVSIASGAAVNIIVNVGSNIAYPHVWSGAGALNFAGNDGVTTNYIAGDGTAFTGTVTTSGAKTWLNAVDFSGAALVANATHTVIGNGTIVRVGSLAGTGTVRSGGIVDGVATLEIGSRNSNTVFAGLLRDQTAVNVLNVLKTGTGTLTLTGANDYTGTTTVNAGTLRAGSTSAFGSNSIMNVASGATLDLGGYSNSIGALAGAGAVTNAGASAATLTSGGRNSSTIFSGVMSNGTATLGFTKTGAGTQSLTGVNSYTGATNVSGGILALGVASALSNGTSIAINNGGTMRLDAHNIWGSAAAGTTSPAITINSGGTLASNNNFNQIVNLTLNGGRLLANGGASSAWQAFGLAGTVNVTADSAIQAGSTGNGRTNIQLGYRNSSTTIFNIASGRTLTVSNILTDNGDFGAANLTVTGGGTLSLSGVNSYTGLTAVNSGTLRAGSTGAFGLNSATTVQSAGTLDLGGFSNSIGSLAGAGTVTNSGLSTAALTIGGLNSSTNFTGSIRDGAGITAVTKIGSGTQTFGGNNIFTGGISITSGAIAMNNNNGLGTAGGNVSIAAGAALNMNITSSGGRFYSYIWSGAGAINFNSTDTASGAYLSGNGSAFTGTVTTSGPGKTAFDIIDFSNAAIVANAETTIIRNGGLVRFGSLSGSGIVRSIYTTSSSATLEVGNLNDNTTFSGVIGDNPGIVPLALVKVGTGTLSLTGASTYTGATTISGGTLAIVGSGSLRSGAYAGAISIASGARLLYGSTAAQTLSGTISGAGAIVKEGAPSVLTLSGVNSYSGGSTINAGTLDLTGSLNPGGQGGTAAFHVDTGAALIGGGIVTTGLFALSGGGSVDLSGPNQIDRVTTTGVSGGFRLRNARSILLESIHANGPVSIRAEGAASDITILSGASVVSGANGDAVVLAAGRNFHNLSGMNAVATSAGRWLVYSQAPSGNSFGGLDSGNHAIWDVGYGTTISATGNRYVFAQSPILTLSAVNMSKVYGEDGAAALMSAYQISGYDPGVTGAYLGDTFGTVLTGTPGMMSAGAASGAGAGTYVIDPTAGTLVAAGGYRLALGSSASLSVTPALLTLTYTANQMSSIYGATLATPSGTASGMGFVNGEGLANLDGSLAWSTSAVNGSAAGLYGITGWGLVSTNYTITAQQAAGNGSAYRINPAALLVTVADVEKVYDGLAFVGGSVRFTGLVNGDTAADLGGLSFGGNSQGAVDAGSYAITASGISNGNYNVSYQPGALSVTPALLTLTYTANQISSAYGAALAAPSGTVSGMGFVNGEGLANLGGSLAWTSSAVNGSAAGLYGITGSGLASTNYTITAQQAVGNGSAYRINPVTLLVTVNDVEKVYDGLAFVGGSARFTGLVNGDTAADLGGLSFGGNSQGAVDAGSYAITASGIISSNYSVSYQPGTLNIVALRATSGKMPWRYLPKSAVSLPKCGRPLTPEYGRLLSLALAARWANEGAMARCGDNEGAEF